MVKLALNIGNLVNAASVSREQASSSNPRNTFICIECGRSLSHVIKHKRNNEIIPAHFRHPPESNDCKYDNGSTNEDYSDLDNLDRAFVNKWKQHIPYYLCNINNKYYHIGSEKAIVTIYDSVNQYQSPKNRIPGLQQHIFILNGIERNIQLRRTEDTCEYYISFGKKCEIEYILSCKATAVVDIGANSVFIINTEEHLPYYYEKDDGAMYLYKCQRMPVTDLVIMCMPNDYISPTASAFDPNTVKQLKNIKEILEARGKQQIINEEARKEYNIAEEQRRTYIQLKEKEMEQRYDEEESRNKIIYELSNNYVPKKLANKIAVKNLYETYLLQYQLADQNTTVVDYARQSADDGTEFIDITTSIIPSDMKCSSYLKIVFAEILQFVKCQK